MLNKPTCIGMCILELRKVLMYEFHYHTLKIKTAAIQNRHW